jgi:2-phospho-L-lactate/phosphoenolpyruvate guanylyltransferase
VHVLVPLKRLDRAKTRLAGSLSGHDRATLMRALVANAAAQAQAASGVERVTLVSSDPAAAELARAHGIEWFDDRALPWNEALTAAMREVVGAGLVGIVSADLPLLRAADIEALATATPARGAAIARATDAGTNAVFMRPPAGFETCFGVPGSAARHADLARATGLDAVVVDRPGTAIDLDSPGDVDRFLALGERSPLRELVADLFANRRIAV